MLTNANAVFEGALLCLQTSIAGQFWDHCDWVLTNAWHCNWLLTMGDTLAPDTTFSLKVLRHPIGNDLMFSDTNSAGRAARVCL